MCCNIQNSGEMPNSMEAKNLDKSMMFTAKLLIV